MLVGYRHQSYPANHSTAILKNNDQVSSKDAPPVAVAQGEAGVANDAILAVPTLRTSTDDEEFTDNYEMMTGNNDHYSLSEQLVQHCGGAILPVHWTACKAVLAFHDN
jgi:hypothetical protein